VITLGQAKSDNINRILTIIKCFVYSALVDGLFNYDHIMRLIILTSDNIKRLSLYMQWLILKITLRIHTMYVETLTDFLF
jgi:hypothetical protein